MGGHQFLEIAAAALFALKGGCLVENQHLGRMAAVGAQKIEQWHTFFSLTSMQLSLGEYRVSHPAPVLRVGASVAWIGFPRGASKP
jgi:hypothetical protein